MDNGIDVRMVDGSHELGVTDVYSADERPQVRDSVIVKAMVCFEDDVHDCTMSEVGPKPKCARSTIRHSHAAH